MRRYLMGFSFVLLTFILFIPFHVHALFEEGDSTISIVVHGSGCYSVSSGEDFIEACGTGTYYIDGDNEVTLFATASEGFHFDGWYNYSELDDGEGNITYPLEEKSITSDKTYTFYVEDGGIYNLSPNFIENPRTQKTYTLTNGDATAIFTYDDGHDFQLSFEDVLELTGEQVEEKYGYPAAQFEKVKETSQNQTIKYGDLISLNVIKIDSPQGSGYSDDLKVKIKMNSSMKQYDQFSLVYLKDDDSTEEVIPLNVQGKEAEAEIKHQGIYALVGESTTQYRVAATGVDRIFHGENVIIHIVMILISVLVIVVTLFIKRKRSYY